MTDIVLFHHAQGLTAGIEAIAYQLGAAGHSVTVPDLYGGATFPTIEGGVAHADEIGFEELIAKGEEAASKLSHQIVYAGFSLGALISHKLAQTREGALGALLYHHGDVPVATFGEGWPEGVDIQIHVSEDDEFYEAEIVEEFIETAGEKGDAELFTYPGSAHLFADYTLPGYEPASAELLMERTLDFLDRH
ncbi:MAG: dienelactone hydrolase family protein [Acidimicrobiia bacterium]|jgi:dienelactone hydrolase